MTATRGMHVLMTMMLTGVLLGCVGCAGREPSKGSSTMGMEATDAIRVLGPGHSAGPAAHLLPLPAGRLVGAHVAFHIDYVDVARTVDFGGRTLRAATGYEFLLMHSDGEDLGGKPISGTSPAAAGEAKVVIVVHGIEQPLPAPLPPGSTLMVSVPIDGRAEFVLNDGGAAQTLDLRTGNQTGRPNAPAPQTAFLDLHKTTYLGTGVVQEREWQVFPVRMGLKLEGGAFTIPAGKKTGTVTITGTYRAKTPPVPVFSLDLSSSFGLVLADGRRVPAKAGRVTPRGLSTPEPDASPDLGNGYESSADFTLTFQVPASLAKKGAKATLRITPSGRVYADDVYDRATGKGKARTLHWWHTPAGARIAATTVLN